MMLVLRRQRATLLALMLSASASWGQQTPSVTLQFAPRDLAIAAGERRQIIVLATVTGPSVRKLRLRARPDPGTHVVVGKTGELPDEIQGDVRWPASIWKDPDGKASSRIVFEAQYETGEKNAPVAREATATFELTTKQRPKNEEVATAVVQTKIEKLEARRPQNVYLVVLNLTDVPLAVSELRVSLPDFARVSVDGKDIAASGGSSLIYSAAGQTNPVLIPPRQEHVFAAVLSIPQYTAVMTGKYLMLFEVKLKYARDGYLTESSIIAPQEFQAGVLGEQEFVGVTSVPFLLLPGFLVVTVLGLLLSKVWPRWAINLDFKKPDFYLFGVIISIATVLLYKPLSPWLFAVLWRTHIPERDLFAGFSLEDIINIWGLALALALGPWVLLGGSARLFAMVKASVLKEQTPTSYDKPSKVLERLLKAGKSFALSQVDVGGKRLWELPLPSPDPAKKWISRRVKVTFGNSTGEVARRFRGLLNNLDKPSGSQKNVSREIYKVLSNKESDVTLLWQPDHTPELVDKKDAPIATGETEEFINDAG